MSSLERFKILAKTCAGSSFVASGMLRIFERFCKPGVTILTYHKINDHDDPLGLTISPEFFEAQLRYLTSRYLGSAAAGSHFEA